MATVAIGDVHGNFAALEDLLATVLPTMNSKDILVFLGDYIDRGPDTRGCLDCILRLQQQAEFTVVTLRGNHEDWMLETMHNPRCHSWILGMEEAFETIASYSEDVAVILRQEVEWAGIRLITERVPIRYDLFFEKVPPEHLQFLERLTIYHRTEDVVCVHGGVDLGGSPLYLQHAETLIWGPDGFPDGYHGPDPIVYGHWNNGVCDERGWPRPCIKENRTFGLDTISRGVLTAMRFPDGKIFQSNQFLVSRHR